MHRSTASRLVVWCGVLALLGAATAANAVTVPAKYSFFNQETSVCLNPMSIAAVPYDGDVAPWQSPAWLSKDGVADSIMTFDWRFSLFLSRVITATYLAFCDGTHQLGAHLLTAGGWTDHGAIFGWDVHTLINQSDDTSREHSYYANVLENDDAVVIALRGSASVADWVKDVSLFGEDTDQYDGEAAHAFADFDGTIHGGFWNAYASETISPAKFRQRQEACADTSCKCDDVGVGEGCTHMRQQVRALLSKADPAKKVYITGHSLGAAIATLVAYGAQLDFPDRKIAFVSYGSPRVGGLQFKAAFDKLFPAAEKRAYRVNDKWDVVTKVWVRDESKWLHVGKDMRINPTVVDRSVPEWNYFMKRAFHVAAVHIFSYEDKALEKLRRKDDENRALARPWNWTHDEATETWTHKPIAKRSKKP